MVTGAKLEPYTRAECEELLGNNLSAGKEGTDEKCAAEEGAGSDSANNVDLGDEVEGGRWVVGDARRRVEGGEEDSEALASDVSVSGGGDEEAEWAARREI